MSQQHFCPWTWLVRLKSDGQSKIKTKQTTSDSTFALQVGIYSKFGRPVQMLRETTQRNKASDFLHT